MTEPQNAPEHGSILPFPPTPTASKAGYTLAESSHKRREEPRRLPTDAPNILIVLLDDVGFGLSDVVGGEIATPAFARVAKAGLCYNTFHTTSICSPTRAALLTGRNHHRVHSGTIAERAVDWDGYTGVIGKDTATVAEVLRHYGYCTSAFGKWHNSPATQTTAMGPFDRWPTGHGFDYFYGFVAGETSQWEPRLYENTNPIEPPNNETYHLSEDLADKAIDWLRKHESFAPDMPFFMYWASGAAHGPHHIFKEPPQSIRGITQAPMEGVSLANAFEDSNAPARHITQYFEMLGHRSIYHDGWRAVCPWPGSSFRESGRKFGDEITYDKLTELDAKGWELYHVAEDFAESKNLADKERGRLIAMIGMWYVEAGKYNVLPIDSRGTARIALERPQIAVNQKRYTLYPNTQAIVAAAAPKILNRPHSFTADVTIPDQGAEGVLLSFGGNDGGFSFYVEHGKLCYLHNYLAIDYFYVQAKDELPTGEHLLSMQFEPTGKADIKNGKGVPAKVTLMVDGKTVAEGQLPHTVPIRLGQGGAMLVGMDSGAPVNPDYKPPFKFTGGLKRVIVDLSGEAVADREAEMKAALRKQ